MDGTIGHYEIIEELGRGGMGVVYKARERSLDRYVALKVLGEHLSQDEEYVARFLREARSAAHLTHPGIVQIYAVGEDAGRHYFAMEYVEGTSIEEVVRGSGAIEPQRASRLLLQAAEALAAAHHAGLIHRDIKPANLLLDARDRLKIADFGLALNPRHATRLTGSGVFLGSPGYLSPEQCRNEELDPRSDLYSLGVTYYEMLAGSPPFTADNPAALVWTILESEPVAIEQINPRVDAEASRIAARLMAKERDARYPDADALVADLERYLGAGGRETMAAPPASGPTVLMDSRAGTAAGAAPEPPPPPSASPPAPPPASAGGEVAGQPSRSHGGRLLPMLGVALLLLLAVGGVAGAFRLGLIGSGDEAGASRTELADDDGSSSPPARRDVRPETPREPAARDERDPGMAIEVPVEVESSAPAPEDSSAHTGMGPRASTPPAAGRTGEEPTLPPGTSTPSDPTYGMREREEPAERRVPPPARGLVVIAVGEPLLAGEVERYLELRLARTGVALIDEDELLELAPLLESRGDPDPAALVAALEGRAGRLLLARVEYLGQRELRYLGRVEPAYRSRVTLTAHDLRGGRALGSAWSETVEYTELSAPRAARKALRQVAGSLPERLRRR